MSEVELRYAPIKVWPGGWDKNHPPEKWSQFTATWSDTLDILDRELYHLMADDVKIQLDVRADQVNRDGRLRADAKVEYPGVILSFVSGEHGALSYPCNAYYAPPSKGGWKHNLRAIALGLEALRKVERYGIANRGQQYAGFAELGSGMALGGMTRETAHEIILEAAGAQDDGEGDWDYNELFRRASKVKHPDAGGDAEYFKLLVEARDLLVGRPG